MNDHKEHITEIAQSAAALYGQDWKALPMWTRERWLETVRHMNRGGTGVNEMERLAGQAIDEWYKQKEVVAVEEVPEPPKKKLKTK